MAAGRWRPCGDGGGGAEAAALHLLLCDRGGSRAGGGGEGCPQSGGGILTPRAPPLPTDRRGASAPRSAAPEPTNSAPFPPLPSRLLLAPPSARRHLTPPTRRLSLSERQPNERRAGPASAARGGLLKSSPPRDGRGMERAKPWAAARR